MKPLYISIQAHPSHFELISAGDWSLLSINDIEQELRNIPQSKKILWNLSGITSFDSAGVLLFIEYFERLSKEAEVEVMGYTQNQKKMYELLKMTPEKIVVPEKKGFIENLGIATAETYTDMKDFIVFLGHLFFAMFHLLLKPKDIRFKEIVYHVHQSGFNALIIIGLTSFFVGMVIAYQGAVQLAKFGADIFIVDTVAISITRELGPLITAIIIAGRSGSAYTAEIGAMKITEEIAAMRTMGFDPYYFLVLPRVFAMMIALPLLIFFADLVGILGGMVAASMELGISMYQFVDRLHEVLEVKHYLLGMVKGPVFAFLIASIGCFRGFQVSDNTESVGLQTTASVVNAIFLVIAFDALFSIIFTEFGI
ncbi:ABC transporter permease [Sulfurovum sp.]|uniref:ABC transporter permease n=1 Tax=Sulfurovum sp. TaxID=1969726 RepID=UPI002867CDAD|nr:ABC transporter permease [Sulfurovum sp.]